ncbi:hypothetical protein AYI70_g1533 [Smittium culicis]|uniref:Uncharacterized protein n=2 Tax=Smittium culicis TaxID=133412 RepID=A0A1R1YCJ1_9FUNG|nr:hypothetical protein AYI70_g1533 [Smittium culicis]
MGVEEKLESEESKNQEVGSIPVLIDKKARNKKVKKSPNSGNFENVKQKKNKKTKLEGIDTFSEEIKGNLNIVESEKSSYLIENCENGKNEDHFLASLTVEEYKDQSNLDPRNSNMDMINSKDAFSSSSLNFGQDCAFSNEYKNGYSDMCSINNFLNQYSYRNSLTLQGISIDTVNDTVTDTSYRSYYLKEMETDASSNLSSIQHSNQVTQPNKNELFWMSKSNDNLKYS